MAQGPVNSTAVVATDRPERYGKQLVSHLSRRATGKWEEDARSGVIEFSAARTELTCDDRGLVLRLTAAGEELDRMEDVVGRHLVRFGTRDELVVRWTRDDGSAGSEQRSDS